MVAVKHILEILINPFFIGLLLISISTLYIYKTSRTTKSVQISLFIGVLCLWITSTGFLPRMMTHFLEQAYPPIDKLNKEIKTVVILGGGQVLEPSLSFETLNGASIKRMLAGFIIFRNNPESHIILSGGEALNQSSEANALADWLIRLGVPRSKLTLEVQSQNTSEQAMYLREKIGKKPFYLVTSAIHMPRSMALFEKKGMHPVAFPVDYTNYWEDERWEKLIFPSSHNLHYLAIAWHEVLGRAWSNIIEVL